MRIERHVIDNLLHAVEYFKAHHKLANPEEWAALSDLLKMTKSIELNFEE